MPSHPGKKKTKKKFKTISELRTEARAKAIRTGTITAAEATPEKKKRKRSGLRMSR